MTPSNVQNLSLPSIGHTMAPYPWSERVKGYEKSVRSAGEIIGKLLFSLSVSTLHLVLLMPGQTRKHCVETFDKSDNPRAWFPFCPSGLWKHVAETKNVSELFQKQFLLLQHVFRGGQTGKHALKDLFRRMFPQQCFLVSSGIYNPQCLAQVVLSCIFMNLNSKDWGQAWIGRQVACRQAKIY